VGFFRPDAIRFSTFRGMFPAFKLARVQEANSYAEAFVHTLRVSVRDDGI